MCSSWARSYPRWVAASQVSWHAAARYAAVTNDPDYRSRVELGLRYRHALIANVSAEVGGLMQFERGLPVDERLRFEGGWVRHWGAGLRWTVRRNTKTRTEIQNGRRAVDITLLAAMQRTTRGYAIEGEDDHGYYVSPAVGVEISARTVKLGLVNAPVSVKLELAPLTLKSWRLGSKDLLIRARYDRLSITAAHVTPSKDQRACGATAAWGAVVGFRLVGPVMLSAGWDLLPGDTHRNALRPTAFTGIGVQVDGGAR